MFRHQKRGSSIWGSEILSDLGRDNDKKNLFGGGGGGVGPNQKIMKRGEIQKKIFRFSDRLPHFSESGVRSPISETKFPRSLKERYLFLPVKNNDYCYDFAMIWKAYLKSLRPHACIL